MINTDATTIHEMFNCSSIEDLRELGLKDERTAILASVMLMLEGFGIKTTLILIEFISIMLGRDIRSGGELLDYIDKSMNLDDLKKLVYMLDKIGDL